MFGKCRVCSEKDRRIEDMREQIRYLRDLLNPPVRPLEIPEAQNLQQDMILDGGGKEETGIQDTVLESPEVLAEREAILSGTY